MNQSQMSKQLALEFLAISKEFRLGGLPTESPHPKTLNLSKDSKEFLGRAIDTIKQIDLGVFMEMRNSLENLKLLQIEIKKTIDLGGRIFLCGCGATGRLSLALETIWRDQHINNNELKERVISFMAGGDVALIHSVEKFEDYPEYGERQLRELGFSENDMLISCTEGGETPFVIGATEAALTISQRRPFFLYCNPDDILIKTAERSKRVVENKEIKKINLTVGPMALTGSTRMQATTILMYTVGLCLWFFQDDFNSIESELSRITEFTRNLDLGFLSRFIECESEIYKNDEYLFYETDRKLGISILTDTTERSPTFSLYPFENQQDLIKNPSLSYLLFSQSIDSSNAWNELLGREPRCFHWPEVTDQTTIERLLGFDFSRNLQAIRPEYLNRPFQIFTITYNENSHLIEFSLKNEKYQLNLGPLNFLSTHLVLKIILNNLSTLVMGRLDRYESNLMTWVRASNNKLVDRAVRYVDILLRQKGINVSYEDLVIACFRLKDQIPRDQSLVLTMVKEFSS